MQHFYPIRLALFVVTTMFGTAVVAQQEPQYTQFMFNKLTYNPGYAGSFVSSTLTAIYRNQWMGIDGAPKTQILSYSQPMFGENVGFGINLRRNSIAISRSTTVEVAYCYRFRTSRGHFGIGVMPSVRNLSQNWNDERLYSPTPAGTDLAIPIQSGNKWLVNFGAGVYFSNDDWFAGLALPRIFNLNIDFSELGDSISREVWHFNAMGGVNLKVSDDLLLTPQALIKFVPHAPFDAEINCSALLKSKFYGALGYRVGGDTKGLGESLNVLLGMQATDNLFFCLSYDIGLTRLRRYSNGSIEATARWWFNPPTGNEVQGDRDF